MKKVEKVGIYDGINERNTITYECWRNMLHRCYNEKYILKNQSYLNCKVCDEWKVFSVFKKWHEENYKNEYQLDKDLLGDGKLYSPQTCCFIPKYINTLLTNKQKNNTSGHPGVCFDKFTNSWIVHTNEKGRQIHHGRYNNFDDAVVIYKKAKNKFIDDIILEYSFLNDKIKSSIRKKGGYLV
jgi:hypothetical protein